MHKILFAYFHYQCSVVVNEQMRFIKKWGWEIGQKVRISFTLLIIIFHLPHSCIREATT